jgi:hypothetical protein
MRHKPKETTLAKQFHHIAIRRPELYNAYQATQAVREERQLERADYLASFIGHRPGKALFVGLYKNHGSRSLSYKEYWSSPEKKELRELGAIGFKGDRSSILEFNLSLTDFYSAWKGRLVINWPGGERSWSHWASKNKLLVDAILEEDSVEPPMPEWRQFSIFGNELRASLWPSWQRKLSEWRGIYLIFDTSDGKGYVGSAYGAENLLGRWRVYADSGHGGNKLLKGRNPANFKFSILERVSPDMLPSDVIALETSWKSRLSTLTHGLNDN